MRVLHVYKTALPESMGGVELVIDQLAQGSIAHGVSAEVFTLSKSDTLENLAYKDYVIHRVKSDFEFKSTPISFAAFPRFWEITKNVDLIHYHFPWPMMDLLHLTLRQAKPTVLTYHSDIIRQKNLLMFYAPFMRLMMKGVDRIVASSPNYLRSSEVINRFGQKVQVIPYGINRSFYPSANQDRVNYWLHRFGNGFFLFVGVFRYYKGLHNLLEAAQGVDFPILIVGAGPIEKRLKEQARSLGLHNVHFLGWVSDEEKVALFQACYGVVFPSHLRSEAFGMTLLEGAMFGKPLISSEIGTGTSFVNIADETGFVVPPDDSSALRQAMRYLREHPEKAADMGKAARLRYEKLFTGERMVSAYVDLYKSIVN